RRAREELRGQRQRAGEVAREEREIGQTIALDAIGPAHVQIEVAELAERAEARPVEGEAGAAEDDERDAGGDELAPRDALLVGAPGLVDEEDAPGGHVWARQQDGAEAQAGQDRAA